MTLRSLELDDVWESVEVTFKWTVLKRTRLILEKLTNIPEQGRSSTTSRISSLRSIYFPFWLLQRSTAVGVLRTPRTVTLRMECVPRRYDYGELHNSEARNGPPSMGWSRNGALLLYKLCDLPTERAMRHLSRRSLQKARWRNRTYTYPRNRDSWGFLVTDKIRFGTTSPRSGVRSRRRDGIRKRRILEKYKEESETRAGTLYSVT